MKLEHGQYQLKWHGNILLVKLVGSFNEEGTLSYIADAKQLLEAADMDGYYMLIDDIELEGATPVSYQLVNDFNQWSIDNGLIAKALITSSPTVVNMMYKMAPTFERDNIRSFSAVVEGLAWLESLASSQTAKK